MTLIPLTSPVALKTAQFLVEADDFADHVSQVQLDPSTSATSWRSINGKVRRDQNTAEWSCTVGLAQDMDPDGLLRYLLDNEGQTKTVEFVPEDGGPSILVDLVIAPATIGGSADGNILASSVSLAVDGRPQFVDPS